MIVHAYLQRPLTVLGKGVGRDGDDGDIGPPRVFQPPDLPGGLVAVQHRHLHIHEDGVIHPRRSLLQHFQTAGTVFRPIHQQALLAHELSGDLGVKVVVLCQQDTPPGKAGLIHPLCGTLGHGILLSGQTAGDVDGEGGALPQLALDIDAAIHQIHQLLHDAHAQAGALHAADGAGALSGKGFKNMLLKLFTHANAVVRHG